jgi:hypothetical protein
MSFFEWVIISIACLLVFAIGYAGITGQSIFSFKEDNDKTSRKQ